MLIQIYIYFLLEALSYIALFVAAYNNNYNNNYNKKKKNKKKTQSPQDGDEVDSEADDDKNTSNSIIIITNEELQDFHDEVLEEEEDDSYRAFRLQVKRNCIKADPELKAMSKEDMQEELANLFDAKVLRYLLVLYHLNRKQQLFVSLLTEEDQIE